MEFFAGANTRNGFVAIFDKTFESVERIYILKGSSGCGKSTLMRRIAGRAQKAGLDVDLVFCSADPDSLDGVIIPSKGIAVVDGTAPHIMDVKYPCVRESIINLGQFWDESKLIPRRQEIINLTDRKSGHYKNAYRCLAASGSVNDIAKRLIHANIDIQGLEAEAFRLCEKVCGGEKGRSKKIFASSFSASGTKVLPVFGAVKTLYRVNGNASGAMMAAIGSIVREKGIYAIESYSATDDKVLDSIYFPETKTLITTLETAPCKTAEAEKAVSTGKFVNTANMSAIKTKLKGLGRLSAELESEAQKELSSAKNIHNEIESIYIPAMNFKALDEYTFALIDRIFAE